VAHREPTKAFLKQSPEAAMFVPFGCIHPLPSIPPFLLKQNLSPKTLYAYSVSINFSGHVRKYEPLALLQCCDSEFIGARSGSPHTSVTSLHPCVCMFACLYAWTDHLT